METPQLIEKYLLEFEDLVRRMVNDDISANTIEYLWGETMKYLAVMEHAKQYLKEYQPQ